jgi:lipopolysaccharide export LptBFGC system permease protein LptF
MKKTILTLMFVPIFISKIFAQTDKEDVNIALALLNKNKKEVISQAIPLNESQQKPFWACYDQYENEYNLLLKKRILLISTFTQNYNTLNDTVARYVAEGMIKNTGELNDLHYKYLKKFQKIAGGVKAATLYQIELYVQTAIQFDVQRQLPIIGGLRSTQ